MTRQRNKSDFVSAAGTMLEIFETLQKLGVTDANWRRVLADEAQADRVATALRSSDAQAVGGAFAKYIEAGRFTYATEYLTSAKHVDLWWRKGDSIRGGFHVIDMARSYEEADLNAVLKGESQRSGRNIQLATAYELAAYAAYDEWNGSDSVIAFGSVLYKKDKDSGGVVACLSGNKGGMRILGISRERTTVTWQANDRVLCISTKVM